MAVSTGKISTDEVRSFAAYSCNLIEGTRSGIQKIQSINETEDVAVPLQLGLTQKTGSTVGTSLKAAMIDSEPGHSTE